MIGKWIAWSVALALLGACVPWAGENSDSLLLVHGSAEVAGTSPAWCYTTLGEPDCFTYPDPAAADRLIGAYVPVQPYPDTESE